MKSPVGLNTTFLDLVFGILSLAILVFGRDHPGSVTQEGGAKYKDIF